MRYALLYLPLLSLAIGCAGSSGAGSAAVSSGTTRGFDIGFTAADAKLHELYPSTLTWQPYKNPAPGAPKLDGPNATIKRDEVSDDQVVQIIVEESGENRLLTRRTTIVLAARAADRCDVSVLSSRSKKNVLFPSRDEAYESARMEEIATLLKAK